MTIQQFCDLIKRKLTTFEHYCVVVERQDVNKRRSLVEWLEILFKWLKENIEKKEK